MKVIVAIDQTDYADQILEKVSTSHWPSGTQIKVLTVIKPLQWECVPCIEWNKEAAEFFKHREKIADEIVHRAKKVIHKACPDVKVSVEVCTGDPKEEITNVATEWMADRIVIGAHGASPNRFFRGSVARLVSQYCACSIQLIRLKPLEEKETAKEKDSEKAHKHKSAVSSH